MPEDAIVQASRSQDDSITRYLDELYRWNRRMNLTTVPRAVAAERHGADVAALLGAMKPAPGAALADVGSGTGIPGILLAIARPDLHIDLVEADGRKAAFLVHVAGLLGLRHARVVPARAETAGHDPAHRERYDHAVSRATAPAPVLCELALPLVRVGGSLAALVGDAAAAAAACVHAACVLGGGTPIAVSRDVIVVPKERATPTAWPRGPGVPQRRPLTRDS